MLASSITRIGDLLERVGRRIRFFGENLNSEVFLCKEAAEINDARLRHLASLDLGLEKQRVLEVGAGIGLLTGFFKDRGCSVVSTDAREVNLEAMKRRFPGCDARMLDLDQSADLSGLGTFDIVFCYGTLYHLSRPEEALKSLAGICSGMILVETCVSPGMHLDVHLIKETARYNQASSGIGCRPTRPWVMETLRKYFGNSYISRLQPAHKDFREDWTAPFDGMNYRAVFVGSKLPLSSVNLIDYVPETQATLKSCK